MQTMLNKIKDKVKELEGIKPNLTIEQQVNIGLELKHADNTLRRMLLLCKAITRS